MPVTTAKIIGFLKKDSINFPIAQKIPSRIRGLDQRSTGYRVQKSYRDDYPVTVSYNLRSPNHDLEISRLQKLAEALTAAGYKVQGTYPAANELGVAFLAVYNEG